MSNQKSKAEIEAEEAELLKMQAEEDAAKAKLKADAEAEAEAEAAKKAANKKASKVLRIFNNTKAVHYIGDVRILPDDKGSEITAEQLEAAKKNPGVVYLLDKKKLEVR